MFAAGQWRKIGLCVPIPRLTETPCASKCNQHKMLWNKMTLIFHIQRPCFSHVIIIVFKQDRMNYVCSQDGALLGYTGPGTTWPDDEMNLS